MTTVGRQHSGQARATRELIAVPSDDHVTIATHFGRARGFILYDPRGEIEEVGYRTTLQEEKHQCGCASGERAWRHDAVLEALDGCRVVIAGGMGAQMYDDLHACGIEVVLTDGSLADRAVEEYVSGSLRQRSSFECNGEPGGDAPMEQARRTVAIDDRPVAAVGQAVSAGEKERR